MKKKRADYLSLRNDMMGARMTTPFEAFLSTAYVSAFLVGAVAAVVIGVLSYVLRVPEMVKYHGTLPASIVALSDYRLIFGTIVIFIFSLLVFGGITYLVFLFSRVTRMSRCFPAMGLNSWVEVS